MLQIDERKLGDQSYLLRLIGPVDARTYGALETRLNQLYGEGIRFITADLSEVDYMSSAGAWILLDAAIKAQEKGGRLVLAHPRRKIIELLNLLGLNGSIEIEEIRYASAT